MGKYFFTFCKTFLIPYWFRVLAVLGGKGIETNSPVKGLVMD